MTQRTDPVCLYVTAREAGAVTRVVTRGMINITGLCDRAFKQRAGLDK